MSAWIEMWNALKHILAAPFHDLSVFWLLAPILILWIVMEAYFDIHKHEELGWNTALGNGVSLFWIAVSLMKHLFDNHLKNFSWGRFIILLVILSYALFITVISFRHTFPAKTTFMLASPTPIYYLSAIAILWAYGGLKMSWWVFLDLVLLFPIIIGIELLIRRYTPEAEESGSGSSGSSSGMKDFSI